jgi:aquaporin Z
MARDQQQLHNDAPQISNQEQHPDDATQKAANKHKSQPNEYQRLLAEILGTFALTVVAAGGIIISSISHGEVNLTAHYVAAGLVIAALIYALGSTSGAHFNPVVTLAFALRRDFPWRRVPGYWIAQLLGAVLASLLLRQLFGTVEHLGATLPKGGAGVAFVMEILLTFLLVTVILGVVAKAELVGNNVAIAVGSTIVLCGLFAGPISGASMNPARSLGPFLVSGELGDAWIYIVGPFVGALLAVGMAILLRGETTPEARKAAQGD